MGKSGKISQYRERLDRALASSELKDKDALETLVRNQLQRSSVNDSERCSEIVIAKRTSEVTNFLDMLRSASVIETSHSEWKLKDDNEEYRVMYRPVEGTPFHSLLVEGYIDGPVDVCLCISCESTLYKKWWPQFTFPPFKITHSGCLQNVRLGEQISLVRVKVPWPMSAREAIVHYFVFEYLQDDLIIVLLNTISDLEGIDRTTHGFTKDGIPEAKEVVRIDVVGGFALQKVTNERSYFRTIANMDMKVDFVPPAFINFISRQLIGSGFRFYQKIVASMSNNDNDYSKALEDPLYAQIRKALYCTPKPNDKEEGKEINGLAGILEQEQRSDSYHVAEEHYASVMQNRLDGVGRSVYGTVDAVKPSSENAQAEERNGFGEIEEENGVNGHVKDEICHMEPELHSSNHVSKVLQNTMLETVRSNFGEIEEENGESVGPLEKVDERIGQFSPYTTEQKSLANYRRNVVIRPEVEQALETLEKAISAVREYRLKFDAHRKSSSGITKEEEASLETGRARDSNLSQNNGVCSNTQVSVQVPEASTMPERTSHESRRSSSSRDIRRIGSSSSTREVNHNKIAPASPERHQSSPGERNEAAIMSLTAQHAKPRSIENNGIGGNNLQEGREVSRGRKHRFCCFVSVAHE